MEAAHPDGGRGLELLESKEGTASDFGVVVHYGLQEFYLNKISGMKLQYVPENALGNQLVEVSEPMTYMEAATQAMHFAVNSIEAKDWPGKDLFKDEVTSCLDQYFSKYELDDMVPKQAELPVSIKIGDYVHTGYIDLIAEWLNDECITDHKTTSLQWDKFMKKWRDVLSLKGYVYSHWKATGNLCHVLINGIRRKGNKALDCEFMREVITYTEDDMAEFEQTVIFERKLMDKCRELGFWPKSGDRCMEVWGECEFMRLCRFPSDAMVKTFYKPRETKS